MTIIDSVIVEQQRGDRQTRQQQAASKSTAMAFSHSMPIGNLAYARGIIIIMSIDITISPSEEDLGWFQKSVDQDKSALTNAFALTNYHSGVFSEYPA